MTERKPSGMSFSSWIDQQIAEAEERGAFDDLPGSGKPLPRRADSDDGQTWLREYLRREGISADVLLPEPLKLLRERELLAAAAPEMRAEREVRDAVAQLNNRIMAWRRIPVGPPVFVPLVDEEAMVCRWRDTLEAGRQPPAPGAGHEQPADPSADLPADPSADLPTGRRRRPLRRLGIRSRRSRG